MPPYLALLPTGYAELAASPRQLVGSCPTVSPLPRERAAVCFLWRCPRIAPPGSYPASCPAKPGLSSPDQWSAAMARPTPKYCNKAGSPARQNKLSVAAGFSQRLWPGPGSEKGDSKIAPTRVRSRGVGMSRPVGRPDRVVRKEIEYSQWKRTFCRGDFRIVRSRPPLRNKSYESF